MMKKLMISVSLCLAVAAGLIVAQYRSSAFEETSELSEPGDHWQIKGALSEACTCNVPCTCNFGEGPSPHSYCYVVYSYQIGEGHFNGVKLDGLRFGGMETAKGNAMYLDARADGEQRNALEAVARKVMRVSGDRMGSGKLLGIKYVEIKQQYDDRHDMLDIGGQGSFKTNYIMGRDKSKPVVVVNNTEWAIHEAIKGKTEYLTIKDEYGNRHSVKNTNSNHGDFEYDEKTQFGSISCSSSCSTDSKGEEKKHKH
jgi:hypothetical protein